MVLVMVVMVVMVVIVLFRLLLLPPWSVCVRGAASRHLLSLPAPPGGQLFLCAAGDPLQRGLHVRLQAGLPASLHLGGLETEMSEEKLSKNTNKCSSFMFDVEIF